MGSLWMHGSKAKSIDVVDQGRGWKGARSSRASGINVRYGYCRRSIK